MKRNKDRRKSKRKTQESAAFAPASHGLTWTGSISTVRSELSTLLSFIHAAWANLSSLELEVLRLSRLSYNGFLMGTWMSNICLPRSWVYLPAAFFGCHCYRISQRYPSLDVLMVEYST